MEIRFESSIPETRALDTEELREQFLVRNLMENDERRLLYTHYDRLIIGGAKPVSRTVALGNEAELRAGYFLERRELGIINLGGKGRVAADGTVHTLEKLSCLYLGMGTREVSFSSGAADQPALFYFLSAPAHHRYPDAVMAKEAAAPVALGSTLTANKRTVYKYIHADGIRSCQLVMGLTVLEPGSVWNSVPPHTHTRRTEVYCYFDLPEDQRIMHFMGQPQQTRHIVVSNLEAVISPPWSVHFGCGTTNYGFVWGMAGENQAYNDMDGVEVAGLR
jgi:4-deoxy-L-threo-5-hexosulose-uronate ketol-isomerase